MLKYRRRRISWIFKKKKTLILTNGIQEEADDQNVPRITIREENIQYGQIYAKTEGNLFPVSSYKRLLIKFCFFIFEMNCQYITH